jgi:hypothetical protein
MIELGLGLIFAFIIVFGITYALMGVFEMRR